MKPAKTHGFIVTRRQFLAFSATAAAVVALVPLAGCGGGTATSKDEAQGLFVYQLSSRGKRASQASKKHNANMLFSTWEAADTNRAHPGDRSRIVRVNISPSRYELLFQLPGRQVVDLRHL